MKQIVPPKIQSFPSWSLPRPKTLYLTNGIPVHIVEMGTQDVLKVEIIFKAGRPFEKKRLSARATARLLKEGTHNTPAAVLAEKIDYFGGTLSIPFNMDTSNVILYCLTRHFEKLAPLIGEILAAPAFPEDELQSFIINQKQRLKVELAKNDVIAYRTITEHFFGSSHPYGYNSFPETYEALTRADLLSHFHNNYVAGNCVIIISGKPNGNTVEILNQYIAGSIPEGIHKPELPDSASFSPRKMKIIHSETVQTAIRIGRNLFGRKHPDYYPMYMLNTILGGYFGSRLMTNIREDKGYTYNIFSSLDSLLFGGYFYIGTEVGNSFTQKTLDEIFGEIRRLRTEPFPEEELNMAKNYLLGHLLSIVDGPFNVADVIKAYVIEDLPLSTFEKLTETIRNFQASQFMELADKYLQEEMLWEVVVSG